MGTPANAARDALLHSKGEPMPGSPPWRRAAKGAVVAGAVTAGTLLLTSGAAFAGQSTPPDTTHGRRPRHRHEHLVGRHRRRARHLHAGRLRPRRDRLLPGQARRPRGEHELRHLRPRLRRLLPDRVPVHVRRLRHARCSASTGARQEPHRLRATGCSCGRAARPERQRRCLHRRRLLAFFLYMVAFMDTTATIPTGAMAERWKWKALRRLGPVLRRHLLPAVRRLDLGRRLAGQLGKSVNLGFGYVDFAGSGVVHAMGGVAAPGRCHRARPPHRQVRQGRQAPAPARPPHPDGDAGHVHPAVRLVRLQRRLDVGRHRRPVRA